MIQTTLTPSASVNLIIHGVNCFEDSTNPSVIRRNFHYLQNKNNIMTLIDGTSVSSGMHFFHSGLKRLQTIKNILHLLQFCPSVRPSKQPPLNLSYEWLTRC